MLCTSEHLGVALRGVVEVAYVAGTPKRYTH